MSHRGDPVHRGVGKGPAVAAAVVLVAAAVVFGGFRLHRQLMAQDRHQSGCSAGTTVVRVTVDPDIADVVHRAADGYNAGRPVVHDRCASVVVTAQSSPTIAAALAGNVWNDGVLGPRPALWIPQSLLSVQRLWDSGIPAETPKPLASTPIVLAVSEPLGKALSAAKIGWKDLPGLQQGSLTTIGYDSRNGLGLALPAGDARTAALVAVATATSTEGADTSAPVPLSKESIRAEPVASAVTALVSSAPKPTGDDPLNQLAAQTGAGAKPGTTGIHAVVTTAQQLGEHRSRLIGYRPTGLAPVADHPATVLTGDWIDETQHSAAKLFTDYLLAHQSLFTRAGFQIPVDPPAALSKTTLTRLSELVENPSAGVNTTVLLDITAGMAVSDGSGTRIANTTAALRSQLEAMPAGSGVGVWLLGENPGDARPFRIAAATAALDEKQRRLVDTTLTGIRPDNSSTDRSYPALEAAFRAATAGYVPRLSNSVLLLTTGPRDNSEITGAALLADIAAATDHNKPVRVDVVAIADTDVGTMRTLAHNTGGTYTRVPTSDTAALGAALGKALSP